MRRRERGGGRSDRSEDEKEEEGRRGEGDGERDEGEEEEGEEGIVSDRGDGGGRGQRDGE